MNLLTLQHLSYWPRKLRILSLCCLGLCVGITCYALRLYPILEKNHHTLTLLQDSTQHTQQLMTHYRPGAPTRKCPLLPALQEKLHATGLTLMHFASNSLTLTAHGHYAALLHFLQELATLSLGVKQLNLSEDEQIQIVFAPTGRVPHNGPEICHPFNQT